MEKITEKTMQHINSSEYKFTKMDAMKNPQNNRIEPIFYFYPNQDFINIVRFNNNKIWITISNCGKYTSHTPVQAIVDEVEIGCQPNFSFVPREYLLILRNTSFHGYVKGGMFKLCYNKIQYPLKNSMEPHFAIHDHAMFEKYLHKATNYFEYGSGGSTYQAAILPNIKHVYSIESDKKWLDKLQQQLKGNSKITYIYVDLKSKPNNWGYPGQGSNEEDWKKYSSQFEQIDDTKRKQVDILLIDGRFRVACCLKCFEAISSNCIISFDDFLNRPKYHVVLDFFDIIDYTRNNRMVMLRRKNGVKAPSKELIQKYEKIPD
jgi:hypothetical protein